MKIKIEEKQDMIDQDGDGLDDRLRAKFTDFEKDSMETSRTTAKLLAHILDELKVLVRTAENDPSLAKSNVEKAIAKMTVAEGERKFEWSPIRREDSEMVYTSSRDTHIIAGGHIRLPFGADTNWTMNLKKNTQQNNIVIRIPQDGIDLKGKRYTTTITKNVNAKFLYIDPEGEYMDIPTWLLKKDGITDKYGNILDGQGKIIATKPQQKKLSNATIPWPKKKKFTREELEKIEDTLVEYLLEIDNEDKSS